MKYGIAFSGGGAKSIAQVAFIEYLELHNKEINFVSGTSAGSLIAALFSMGLNSQEILFELKDALYTIDNEKLLYPTPKDFIFNKQVKHGILDATWLENLIDRIVHKYNIHELSDVKIPLAITSVDLYTGELIVFVSHPHLYNNTHPRTKVISDSSLAQAIRASMSFPLVFGSMEYEDHSLIDGGVRMNCPIPMLKDYGADKTLAITMRGALDEKTPLEKKLAVANRVFELMSREAENRHVIKSDLVFNVPLGPLNIFDTQITDFIFNEGRKALIEQSDAIEAFFKPTHILDKIFKRK